MTDSATAAAAAAAAAAQAATHRDLTNFIDGQHVGPRGGRYIDNYNPALGEVCYY